MAKINFNKMTYKEIEQRYIEKNILGHYQFKSAEEVKDVLGWDFRTIRGMKDLSEDDRALAEKLICNYLNGWGLEYRHEKRPESIKKELRAFKVAFLDEYSYLYFDGAIG